MSDVENKEVEEKPKVLLKIFLRIVNLGLGLSPNISRNYLSLQKLSKIIRLYRH